MPPNPRTPPPSERIVKQEVLTETLKSDIRELKESLADLEDKVGGLNVSQQVQLNDLSNIKGSIHTLETVIRTMTTTVRKAETARELDVDIEKTMAGVTIAKVKSYFMIGVTIAGVIWGIIEFSSKVVKVDTHLIDEVHQGQLEADQKKK